MDSSLAKECEEELRFELARHGAALPTSNRECHRIVVRARNLIVPRIGRFPGELVAEIVSRALDDLGVPDEESSVE